MIKSIDKYKNTGAIHMDLENDKYILVLQKTRKYKNENPVSDTFSELTTLKVYPEKINLFSKLLKLIKDTLDKKFIFSMFVILLFSTIGLVLICYSTNITDRYMAFGISLTSGAILIAGNCIIDLFT